MIYPGSTPEFRVLVKSDGTQALQIRYVKFDVGYTGKWQDVPIIVEEQSKQ